MVILEDPLCAGTERLDREEAIFQSFDFHFLIAAATEAVALGYGLRTENSSCPFPAYIDRVEDFSSLARGHVEARDERNDGPARIGSGRKSWLIITAVRLRFNLAIRTQSW